MLPIAIPTYSLWTS